MRYAISYITLLFILTFSQLNAFAQDYVAGEIIIQYQENLLNRVLTQRASSESKIIDILSTNYHLGLKSQTNGKKYRKLIKTNSARKSLLISKNEMLVLKFDNQSEDIEALAADIKNSTALKNAGIKIQKVYPNYLFEVDASSPNDTLYPNQWALPHINANLAWDKSDGAGAVVAVIDTGVDYKHEDLKANIWRNEDEIAGNGIDDDNNGFIDDIRGWDFIADGVNCAQEEDCSKRDANPNDVNGHGTHVSGIVAAVQNNSIGISGIAVKAKIMPLKAAFATVSSALLKSTDVYDAITYATDNGADVINMSFAGKNLGILESAIREAHKAGVVFVAAAGNQGSSEKMYPAALPEVISVGAIDPDGEKTSFSNYGDWVDIVAPGSNIYSTLPKGAYGFKSGTSMASPYVAGVAALIKSRNKVSKLSADEVKQRILDSGFASNFLRLDFGNSIKALNADIDYPLEVASIRLPSQAVLAEPVSISASVNHRAGETITAYAWRSDIDGKLSDEASFKISSLSLGEHKIFLSVQNNLGEWSKEASANITITQDKGIAQNNSFVVKIAKRKRKLIARAAVNQGQLAEYRWMSDIDGLIGNKRVISTRKLSRGAHAVSLTVRDSFGNWSPVVQRLVRVK